MNDRFLMSFLYLFSPQFPLNGNNNQNSVMVVFIGIHNFVIAQIALIYVFVTTVDCQYTSSDILSFSVINLVCK